MNFKCLALFLFIFSVVDLSAQFAWSNPQPSGFNNNKVLFADATTGYILNDNGDLIKTTNAGSSWKVERNFRFCKTMDVLDSTFVIAGGDTTVYISSDRGETWGTSTIKHNNSIIKIEVVSKDTILMASSTQLFQSINGGKTWGFVNSPFIIRSIDFINSKLAFATSSESIFKTVDGGRTWQTIYTRTGGYSFITTEFRDSNNGFVYQDLGALLKTADGGATWSVSKSEFSSRMHSITFINSTTILIAGEDGHFYRSTDNGSTWTHKGPKNTGYAYGIYSMCFVNEQLAFAVGLRGRILKTTDLGESYQEYSPTYTDIKPIVFPTSAVGYAASWNELLKTTDSGKTWVKLPFFLPIPPYGLNRFQYLHFFSADTGIALAESPVKLYKTYDGGQTWKTLSLPILYKDYILGFSFLKNTGYLNIEGNGYTMLQSKDQGETWEVRSNSYQAAAYRNLHFMDEKTGYGNMGSTLYKTTDSAKTWKAIMNNTNTINSIWFTDVATGYIGGNDGYNSKSIDSGKTWNRMYIFPNNFNFYDVYAMRFFSKRVGYLVSKWGGVYKTIDAGANWREEMITPWDCKTIEMTSDTSVFIAGTYGAILKKDMREHSIDSLKVISDGFCSARVSASITAVLSAVDSVWFEYGTTTFTRAVHASPAKVIDTTQKAEALLKDLSGDSTYMVRVKALYRGNYYYSSISSFKPVASTKPTITLIRDTILRSSSAINYQWYLNNNKLSADTLNSVAVQKIGFYRVETSPNKICWQSSDEYPVLVLGSSLTDTLKVGIYPNPAVGMFNVVITLPSVTGVVASVSVVNASGNVVLQTEKVFFYSNQIRIPITLNATGVFNVKVTVNGQVKTQTVILQ